MCASDQGGCGKIRILAGPFEEDVTERLFSRIDEAQLRVPEGRRDDPAGAAMAEMARLEAVRGRLAEMAGAGEMDLAEFRAAKTANDLKLQALRESLARSAEEEALERARSEAIDLRAKWAELDIEAKRRFVRALAERIDVVPAVRGRNFYTPERVRSPTDSEPESWGQAELVLSHALLNVHAGLSRPSCRSPNMGSDVAETKWCRAWLGKAQPAGPWWGNGGGRGLCGRHRVDGEPAGRQRQWASLGLLWPGRRSRPPGAGRGAYSCHDEETCSDVRPVTQ